MTRIDLRYVIPVVAFYLPGLMMLTGGWVLGFSVEEMRETVALIGALSGGCAFAGAALFTPHEPVWLNLRKGESDD